ncbi:hypothetical protein ACIQC9_14185 [Brevundimonas sp. NPDC092305]|uniref:hypothetical protein n=1 Tax=Brevundimonas sp. NPDC092305 TaxID=3363957 RepID=UPI00380ACC9B
MKHALLALALSSILAGAAVAAPPQAGGVIDRNGVRLLNTDRSVAFGATQADVVAHATRVFGGAPILTRETDCRNGAFDVADWGKGLKLIFQDGKFVGWSADRTLAAGYTNRAGTVFGRPVSAIAAENAGFMLSDAAPRGRAFVLDGVNGLVLAPGQSATIDVLWAGASCRKR